MFPGNERALKRIREQPVPPEWPRDAPTSWADGKPRSLQEAVSFKANLHPRDRRGRFRETADPLTRIARESGVSKKKWVEAMDSERTRWRSTEKPVHMRHLAQRATADIGITPFRGAGQSQGEDYRQTSRYKGFINALSAIAEDSGVVIQTAGPTRGVWDGGGEPSVHVQVQGSQEAIRRFMDEAAADYQQDAAISFRAQPGARGKRYVSTTRVDADATEAAMSNVALPGATVNEDGYLEVIDVDDTLTDQVVSLASSLGIQWYKEDGNAELRFAGTNYEKRSRPRRRRRAQESAGAVPGDAARPSAGDAEGHDQGGVPQEHRGAREALEGLGWRLLGGSDA